MFTVNEARSTNQLETVNQQLHVNKRLFHQNGFARTSLSATVTRVSFVENDAFSHTLPNTSNTSIAMHSACSKHWINVLRFTLYHVEGRLKLLKFQHWQFSWLSTIQLLISKEYSHAPKMSRVGYLALVTGCMWLFSHTNAYEIEWSLCKLAVGKICPTSLPMWDKRN